MAVRPWRWLVLFFTRPIRLSDFAALASRLKPSPRLAVPPAAAKPDPVPITMPMPLSMPVVAAALRGSVDVRRARASSPRKPAQPRKDAGASGVASMFHPELAIGVSEQPIDTLPAELRDELERPSTGRLQGSLHDR